MTIVIGFSQKQLTTYDQFVLDKLRACYEAIKYFQNRLFVAHTVEIWYDAPSEALGGDFQGEIPAQNLYNALQILESKLKSLTFQDLHRTIIIFRGVWSIENVELAGYFSLHNPKEWREVYGDLEISAYGQDLADAFWLRNDAVEVISDFVKSLNRNVSSLRVAVNLIVFCKGLWNKHEPENLRVIYMVNEMRGLLSLFYVARRKEKNWDMETFARPLDTTFLLDTLEKTEIVQDRFSKDLKQDVTLEVPIGSKLYIGKEPDSFKKLYKDVTETIIKPALSKLPKDSSVKQQIEEGLKEFTEVEKR
jgi:hypothetical protein